MALFSPKPRPVSSVQGGTGNPVPEVPQKNQLTETVVGEFEWCANCYDWFPCSDRHRCKGK